MAIDGCNIGWLVEMVNGMVRSLCRNKMLIGDCCLMAMVIGG